ncbi:N-alpha-acetyltransferase 25, NatB auxiliary subunit, partial [Irineochytrium annulatum]
AALKMHKQFKNDKYLFWAVTCLYLQVRIRDVTPPTNETTHKGVDFKGDGANIFLPLAEKMMVRASEEGKVTTYEALQLYMSLLDCQDKTEDGLKVIQGPLGGVCKVDFERQRIEMRLLKRAKKHQEVKELARKMVKANPEDWKSYTNLFDAIYEAGSVNLEDTEVFITSLQEKKGVKSGRGPYLAELELKLRSRNFAVLKPLVLAYLDTFGALSCCFEDVRPYLKALKENRVDIMDSVNVVDVPTSSSEDVVAEFKALVNRAKTEFYAGPPDTMDALSAYVARMRSFYDFALELGKDLVKTERQYGDDCLILAAHAIIELWSKSPSSDATQYLVYDAITLVERALAKSTYNFQFKILLIRLYLQLGSYKPVVSNAQSLDVKQILHDTLTHLFADELEVIAPANASLPVFVNTLTLYRSNELEIPEFLDFRNRLNTSLQKAITVRQVMRAEVFKRAWDFPDLHAFVEAIEQDSIRHLMVDVEELSDNRDITIVDYWSSDGTGILEKIRGRRCPVERVCYLMRKLQNLIWGKKKLWLQRHGLIPLVLRTMIRNEHSPSLLESLRDVTKQEEDGAALASKALMDVYALLQNPDLIENKIDAVLAPVKAARQRLEDELKSDQWHPTISTLEPVHSLFEAFAYLHIGTQCANERKSTRKITDTLKKEMKAFGQKLSSFLKLVLETLKEGKWRSGRTSILGDEQGVEKVMETITDSWDDVVQYYQKCLKTASYA